jgi:calcium-dependent protein kinase
VLSCGSHDNAEPRPVCIERTGLGWLHNLTVDPPACPFCCSCCAYIHINQVRNLTAVRSEVAIMQRLRHPNVLKIEDALFDSARFLHIVIELCTGGELYEAICARGHLGEDDVVGLMRQILAGIRHCHAAHVVHRDLKPQNLLFLNAVGPGQPLGHSQLKLVDFGVSKIFVEHQVLHKVSSCCSA